jgi:hypothetical protein
MSKTTILPDGSGFSTATIMSKEEAMKLPLKDRPICLRISSEMYHGVFESVGAASMTFNKDAGNEVFNSEEASKIAVDLCFKIAKEVETQTKKFRDALEQVARYDDQSIWSDDRDDAADDMLSIAREALGEEE